MDRRQLEHFLAVVDEGSVTRAASTLHVSQPAVSNTIRTLERELGGLLFERVGRDLVLTAAGAALVPSARTVLTGFSLARERVQDVLGLEGGTLDIATVPALSSFLARQVLPPLTRAHPGVSIHVHTPTDAGAIPPLVAEGRHHVGITLGGVVSSQLVVEELDSFEYQVLLPAGSDAAPTLSLEEISRLTFVSPPLTSSNARRVLVEALTRARLHSPRVIVEISPHDRVIDLVREGVGAAIVSEPIARAAGPHGLSVHSITPPLTQEASLVYRPGPLQPALRAFLAHIPRRPGAPVSP